MKRIIVLFFVVALITSCFKDNDDEFDAELAGKWTLTNASCFCGFGENPDFSGHKLTFQDGNLTVENTGEFKFLVGGSGSYLRNGKLITLANGRQYTYVVKGNTLELTFVDDPQTADDELFLEYKGS